MRTLDAQASFKNAADTFNAESLIAQGMNPYAAHLKALNIPIAVMAQAMDFDVIKQPADWPSGVARNTPQRMLEHILAGRIIPEVEMVLGFCLGAGIMPDQLARKNHPDPATPEIVETAVLFFDDECVNDAQREGLRVFLAGEVMKARNVASRRLQPGMARNSEILGAVEKFYYSRDAYGVQDVDDTTAPSSQIACMQEAWQEAMRLYGDHVQKQTGLQIRGDMDVQRVQNLSTLLDYYITDSFDFDMWRRAPQTRVFLEAEANGRHVLTFIGLEALGLTPEIHKPAPFTLRHMLPRTT